MQTTRRVFVVSSLGALTLVARRAVNAQEATKRITIGVLSPSPPMRAATALVDELRTLGYVEGRNLTIDYRWAMSYERLPEAAAALGRLPLDAVVIVSTPAAGAMKQVTKTIPVVMAASADPVGGGVVESLGRPGGNITGLALMNPDLTGKRVEVLKQLVPQLTWLGGVHRVPSGHPVVVGWLKENVDAGRRLGIHIEEVRIGIEPADWEQGLLSLPKRPGIGLTILEDPAVVANSGRLSELLLKHRLPAVFPFREHVEDGGLVSYGVNLADLFRRSAHYVDKIVRGAKAGDLPIEQPTKFELLINLKTAKALGLTVSRSLLARANELIQ